MGASTKLPPGSNGAPALDPAMREKVQRWFAEAHEQTKRDDEDIAAWHRRLADRMDGIGGPYFTETRKD